MPRRTAWAMAKIGWFLQRCLILFSLGVVDFFFKVLNRTRVEGAENIPAGAALIVSNHLSYLDPPLIGSAVVNRRLTDTIYAPAKASLFRVPIFAQLIKALGAFPVEHSGRDMRGIKNIANLMKANKVMLFPEGTRSRSGQLGEGIRMVGSLVRMAMPAVVPAAIRGTDKVLGPGMKMPRLFKRIDLIIGKPLDLSLHYEMSGSKEAAEAITREIMEAIKSLLAGQSAGSK